MRATLLAAALVGCGGPAARADDRPPKELTPAERAALAAEVQELNVAGVRELNAAKFDDALGTFGRAVAAARRLSPDGDHEALAQSLGNLGTAYRAAGRVADAEAPLQDALAMRRRLLGGRDHPALVNGMGGLAAVLYDRGRAADAVPVLADALAMSRRLHGGRDHPEVAGSLNNLGFMSQEVGKLADAERLYRDALAMRRRLHADRDHPEVAQSLNNLGFAVRAAGKLTEADGLYRDALAMSRRVFADRDHPTTAFCLANLGSLDHDRGRAAAAEPLLREALEVRRRLYRRRDHPEVAQSLGVLAAALRDLGRATEAEQLYRDALDMYRRLYPGRDHPEVARGLSNLAVTARAVGRADEAARLRRDALDMYRRLYPGRDRPEVIRELNNQAVALEAEGRPAEAEPLYREALAANRRLYPGGDRPELAHALNNLGVLLTARGDPAAAGPLHREALGVYRRAYPGGDHPDVARGLANLAAALRGGGRPADAEPPLRDAVRMYARLAAEAARVGAEGDALTLAAAQPASLSGFLSNARDNRSGPAAVYAEVWTAKATVARGGERRALAARAAADPRAAALLTDLRDARRRRADLLLAPRSADPGTRDARDADLDALARRVADLNAQLLPILPAVGRLDALDTAAPDDLRKALPPGAAFVDLLAYSHIGVGPKKPGDAGKTETPSYTAFVVTGDGVTWADLGPAGPIEAAVAAWRAAITAPPYAVPDDLPAALRRLVWEPVRKALPAGTTTVYVSPDAALTGLPWAALPGDQPGTVLIEDYAVAVVPHGRFLLDALGPPDPSRRKADGLLAVGGVPYGGPADRPGGLAGVVAAARSRTRGDPPADPAKKLVWDDLPGAKLEAEGVQARAAGRNLGARLVAGPAASADRVLDELPKVRYAHLATHGFFADKPFRSVLQVDPKLFEMRGGERVGAGALNPMVMSGLVFAGANRPDTPGRGLLTGEALLDRDLSGLELAVLSACETGLGDVAGGEGVFGLQRAFHLAGCRNVVASLWKVNDDATAALMAEFYGRLWDPDRPLPPAEALRQAQLAVRRADPKGFRAMAARGVGKGDVKAADVPVAGTANPPAYWAGFVLSGPGR